MACLRDKRASSMFASNSELHLCYSLGVLVFYDARDPFYQGRVTCPSSLSVVSRLQYPGARDHDKQCAVNFFARFRTILTIEL